MRDNPSILIVDDAREIVRGISLRLRSIGFDVLTAYDGKSGLETAIKSKPSAIILDIRMPIMDGLTMLAKLRSLGSLGAIPTIVLSANIASDARSQASQLGACCFLEKPYDATKLLNAIQSAVKEETPSGLPATKLKGERK